MENKKVWVVTAEWVSESDPGLSIEVFDSHEKAKTRQLELILEEITANIALEHMNETEIITLSGIKCNTDYVIEDFDDSWLWYEVGCYSENHTSISVFETMVK